MSASTRTMEQTLETGETEHDLALRDDPHAGWLQGDRETPQVAANVLHRDSLPPPSARDRIVAVIAPSGYGKTTLAVQWLHDSPADSAAGWMQVDERCRDPAEFLYRLDEALAVGKNWSGASFHGADEYAAAIDSCLTVLRLRAGTHHLLFIDDVHLLAGCSAMQLFTQLLQSAPRNLTLVLTSREADGLGLAALALRGEVRWVTSAQLVLSRDEIAALATHNGISIGAGELDSIAATTEGWPALTQLALYGLQGQAVAGRAPIDPLGMPVASYIHDRFLAGLTDEQRSLISILAVVPEATLGLIESLAPGSAMNALTHFERMGVIRRRGRAGGEGCYVIHPLIRDEVSRREDGSASQRRELQASAAAWWWAHDDPDRAIRLALAAGMKNELREWLRQYGPVLVNREGRHETFLELLTAAERLWQERDAELSTSAVSSLMFLRRYPEAERLLEETSRNAAANDTLLGASNPAELQRAVIAGLRDDFDSAGRHARAWLSRGGGDLFHQGLAWIVVAFSQKCLSQFAEVGRSLEKARDLLTRADSSYGMAWARVINALALLKEGRFREVLAESDVASREVASAIAGIADVAALTKAISALVYYERGEFEQCKAALEVAMPSLHRQGIVDAMIAGYVAAARLQAAQGRLAAALDLLAEGQRVGVERNFERLRVTLVAERAMMLARHGALREARTTAQGAGLLLNQPPSPVHRDKGSRLFVRVALAENRLAQVGEVLAPALAHARATGQRHKIAELLLLDAVRLHRGGHAQAAFSALIESLEIGLHEGYRRIYLDEGEPLLALLRALPRQPSVPPPVAAFGQRLLQGATVVSAPQDAAMEPLSEREQQVLRLVGEGRTNQEIAQQLFLTEGTVKWHLHNLYGKLGVSSRTAALHAAQRAGLMQ
ncbi:MAG: LuxR C-terminal-related transcriptional regulator [Panacagrimonas sp.]